MRNSWKKTAAFVLAFTLVAAPLTQTGSKGGLFRSTLMSAYADGTMVGQYFRLPGQRSSTTISFPGASASNPIYIQGINTITSENVELRYPASGSFWEVYLNGTRIYHDTPAAPLGILINGGSGTQADPYTWIWNYNRGNGAKLSDFHPGDVFYGNEISFTESSFTLPAMAGKWITVTTGETSQNYSLENGATLTGLDASSTFEIYTPDISTATINLEYNTANITSVRHDGKNLTETTEYTVQYTDADDNVIEKPGLTDYGSYHVTVTGAGKYSGSVTKDFSIVKVQQYNVTLSDDNGHSKAYNNTELDLTINNRDFRKVLEREWGYEDYSFMISSNIVINADTESFNVQYMDMSSPVFDPSSMTSMTIYVTVEKLQSAVTTAPTALENLTATGSAMALLDTSNAAAENGTLYYALGENADTAPTSGWSATAPTETAVGTYYVWYKAVGNNGYADTTPVCIVVEITSLYTELTADNVTIADFTYDGTEKTPVLKYGDTTLLKDTDYTIAATEGDNTSATNAGTYFIHINGTGSYAGENVALTWKINKADVNVTADAKSKKYGEDDPVLTYTAGALFGTDAFTGALAREEGENAGTYAIKQGTLSAGDNYNITFTGADFTITKIPFTLTGASLTYNGDAQNLISGDVPAGTKFTLTAPKAGLDYTAEKTKISGWISALNDKASNASSPEEDYYYSAASALSFYYSVLNYLNKNYESNPANVMSEAVSSAGKMAQYEVTPSDDVKEAIDYINTYIKDKTLNDAKARFATVEPDDWSDTITATNAGTYTVYYKGSGNYDDTVKNVTASIAKATASPEAPTNLTAAFGKKLSDIELPDGWAWDAPETSVGDVGNNTFAATFTPTDTANYNNYSANLTVAVTAISATPTAVGTLNATYGDTLADVELPKPEDGTWAWKDDTTSVGNAGEQTFKAVFTPSSPNYTAVEQDVTINVAKATLTPTVSVIGWTYGDTQNVPVISGISDLQVAVIGVPQITGELWKYNGTEYEKVRDATLRTIPTLTGTTLDAGTYKVKLVVAENTNYEEGEWWSNEFAVTKAGSSVETAPAAVSGLIYDGTAKALVTAGTASGGNMWYSLDNSNWYEDIPTGINATTYTVYYKVVGDGNHNDNNGGSVEVNIAKADIVSSGNIANDTVWLTGDYIDFGDGAYIQSSWSPNSGKWHLTGKHKLGYGGFYTDHYWFVIEGECDFNLNNDGKSGQPVYGLTISGSGTENDPYTAVPLHMPYATVTVSTAKDLIYSGSAQLLVTEGSSNGGTVKYSLGTADVAGTEWTTDISTLTGTIANTYYVWYYVEGDANHNNTDRVCIPVTISQMSLENAVIILDKDAFEVNEVSGETPAAPTVAYVIVGSTRLTENTDYRVYYENNTSISANTPTVVITGTGNYGGTARKSFTIGTDLSDAVVTVNSTFKYNGTAKTPGVTVTYKGAVVNAANYIVSYSNNINAGTATVTITGKTENGYTGSASATFAIAKAGIASVSASGTYAYTGEAIIPTLVVKDENGAVVDAANYNVEFVNNIKAGTATIVVTAKDGTNYTGTKTGTFEIGHRYTEIAETRADCSTPGVMAHWIDENSATYLMNANNQYVAVTAANLAIPATGAHIYDTEDIQWYWTTDNSGAFAVFTCVDCGTKTNVNAVVTSSPVSGGTQYTATVTLGETEYTESKTVKNKYVVAYSEISDYKLANITSGISFTYRNTYNGDEAVVYGFLCYREGILNEYMTVDTAGVAKITKPSATGTIGATDKGTGIYLRSYIKIGDVYVYGDQVYVKHSDLMNQKAYDEAVTEISDYKLANTTSGISFTYRNTYNGDEAVVYGFLCYREGILNEDMTVDTAGVAKITKPSATGTIGATDKGTGIYLRSYIRIGDKYKYGEQVYVKHSDLMNQKAFNEASSKITGYALANTTSGISFNYSNTYKGTEDAVYGFLCYRDGVMNEDMTVDTAGIAKITKPSATGTIGATDKGTGIYLRSYIKIGDEYKYGEQVYVKHSDLLKQKTLDDATSVITGYEIVNSNGGVKFTYKNTYTGPESAEYGFLCYREGILNEDMKVDMAGISKVTKTSATGTIGATDKGTGIYLRSYIKIGDVYVYGEQVFVRFSNQ